MDIEGEVDPLVQIYVAMAGATAVTRAFASAMERLGKGDEMRAALRRIEEERELERRRLVEVRRN